MTSAALQERRVAAMARSLEITGERLVGLVAFSFDLWRIRAPWRWLPVPVQWWGFQTFARRWTERRVAHLIEHGFGEEDHAQG